MAREEIKFDSLDQVTGGSYQLNHDSGKCVIGSKTYGFQYWQLSGDYDNMQIEFDAIMNGEGSDDDKNDAIINLINANGWGTRVK